MTRDHFNNLKKDYNKTEAQRAAEAPVNRAATRKHDKLRRRLVTYDGGDRMGKYDEYPEAPFVLKLVYMSDEDSTDDESLVHATKKGLRIRKPTWHSQQLLDLFDTLDKDYTGPPLHRKRSIGAPITGSIPKGAPLWAVVPAAAALPVPPSSSTPPPASSSSPARTPSPSPSSPSPPPPPAQRRDAHIF
ncbi:hypothetical protein BDA99DRAFT_610576 [Phascolomyces articulosus]|uniref:Uncharacterized protein n=1 Tax=Phascolomyces articulosus TaxID=60185 RepID=A0AAD5JWG2_9FUNG|nr:hypothetical protein BDA99DRAFT_610576 [Phascolomyces articulosus]